MGLWLLTSAVVQAQQPTIPTLPQQDSAVYSPKLQLPAGPQVVVVYIGTTYCGASRDAELKAAIRRMKPLIARQADSLHVALSITGVALDWPADSGVAYLKSLGAWDEMIVGNNWVNLGAEHFIWRETNVRANIPQVVIYHRDVRPGKEGITFGPSRRAVRIIGVQPVIEWVNARALLPREGDVC